jgi:hypothetical protein
MGADGRSRRNIAMIGMLVFVVGALGIMTPDASSAKAIAPSCSIQVTGDGTNSVTFDATFVGVPKRGTTQLTVDGDAVADPFTTNEVGTHEASCGVLRNGRQLFGSSTVMATVAAPTYECDIDSERITAFTVRLDWSVTVTNPDGTIFDVWVWAPALGTYEAVTPDASGTVSGTLNAFDGGIATQFNVGAFVDDTDPTLEMLYCWRSNLGTGSG